MLLKRTKKQESSIILNKKKKKWQIILISQVAVLSLTVFTIIMRSNRIWTFGFTGLPTAAEESSPEENLPPGKEENVEKARQTSGIGTNESFIALIRGKLTDNTHTFEFLNDNVFTGYFNEDNPDITGTYTCETTGEGKHVITIATIDGNKRQFDCSLNVDSDGATKIRLEAMDGGGENFLLDSSF